MKTILPACIALLLPLSPAFAWQQSTSDTTDVSVDHVLPPIEVSATRYVRNVLDIPYAVDRVDRNAIQLAEPGLSLEESVRSLPGIIVHNRNNVSQGDRISIRGLGSRASFGVRGVKLVLDGIPLTMADGQSQLNNLDLTSAGQIEVLRGPSSSLYGNAAGGVIQIRTEGAPDAPLSCPYLLSVYPSAAPHRFDLTRGFLYSATPYRSCVKTSAGACGASVSLAPCGWVGAMRA
jgi:iron complex outermembrane receptor protein